MQSPVEETTFSLSRAAPAPPERRQQARHITILRVGTLIIDGARELCLVRNISAGGLMAHVYSNLEAGARLTVELRCDDPIAGTVTWIDGNNVGIGFDAEIDVEALLAPPAAVGGRQPRMPRVQVNRCATFRIGGRTFWSETRDISQGGVKLEVDGSFRIGDQAVVTLDGFRPLPGVIRWSQEGLIGIAFNEVVPFRELMRWLRAEPGPSSS